jgi:DNA-binding transcriptional regulator YiaG
MMPGEEFRKALQRHGMSQVGFARYTGVDQRTVRRWAAGEFEPPKMVHVIIELLDQRLALRELLQEGER